MKSTAELFKEFKILLAVERMCEQYDTEKSWVAQIIAWNQFRDTHSSEEIEKLGLYMAASTNLKNHKEQ